MRSTDAFTWRMERDPALRSTVVSILWLDGVPDWESLVERIDRMSRLMPALRQKVVETSLPLATPRWVFDTHFDLGWHLRRVVAPPPATVEAVLELGRQAAMAAFDRDRPLWEFTLVEGVDGPHGAKAAMVLKVHHALSDGVGGMRMLTVMFDLERHPEQAEPLPEAPEGEVLNLSDVAVATAEELAAQSSRLAGSGLRAAPQALRRVVTKPLSATRESVAFAASVYRTAGPMRETFSPVMQERAMTRRLAMLEVPLSSLKAAAGTVGATVNAAYLTALTGGLREYHQRHGVDVDSLRVTMPISLRAEGDETEWGNRITLQRVTLPVAEPDPSVRMRATQRVIEAARSEPSLGVTDVIAGALNVLPAGYVGGVLKHVDFLASDVTGSPVPLYLAGAEVSGFFAFGPTIGAALNATLISHHGTCDVGVNMDTAAIPDPEVMGECLDQGFAEVVALSHAGDQ
jgi:WS/DGAT/MGAT family acyltransferase